MRRMPTGKQLEALDKIKVDEEGKTRIFDLDNGVVIPSNVTGNTDISFSIYEEYPFIFLNAKGVKYSISNWSDGIYFSVWEDNEYTDIAYLSGSTFDLYGVGIGIADGYIGNKIRIEPNYAQGAGGYDTSLLIHSQEWAKTSLTIAFKYYSAEEYQTDEYNYLEIGTHYNEQGASFTGPSIIIRPQSESVTLTCAPSGTATLKIHRTSGEYFHGETEIIPDRIGLHMDITGALGANTSQRITITQEEGIDLSELNATGVLLNGTTLVGCCHLVGTSANQAILYFQNALGTDLQAGVYTANLTSVLEN